MSKTFTFTRSVLAPYSAEMVYSVINDVPNYHRFLPNCQGSGVLSRTAEADGERVLGYMDLGLLGLSYRLESNNLHHTPHSIDMNLSKGPFEFLRGHWQITTLSADGCKVALNMTWAYNSIMLATIMGQRFESIASQLLDAFMAETAKRASLSNGKA